MYDDCRPAQARPREAIVRDLSGSLIDKYRLVRLIGKGGMGAVYEAQHELIGRRCALKVLHPDVADEETNQRMLREARAAAAIGHPCIVETTDFGVTPDGIHYMVMEFLAGKSLATLIEQHAPLPLEPTVAIVIQVLEALEAAHAKGVVHRDLKPDNVFITNQGGERCVKLLDFGISLFNRGDADAMRLTRTGAVMGTPFYMSPEQAEGDREIDGRADLWSVGVLFYEALAGEVPFPGSTFTQVVLKIVTANYTPLPKRRPDLSPAVWGIIERVLTVDPEQRFRSATEMIGELRAFTAHYQPGPGGVPGDLECGAVPGISAALGASSPGLPAVTPHPYARSGELPPVTGGTMSPAQVLGRESRLGDKPKGRRRGLIWLAVGAPLTLLVVVLALVLASPEGDEGTAGSPRKKAAMQPVPDQPQPTEPITPKVGLKVALPGLPPGAQIKLDGWVVTAPLILKGDDTEHTLVIRAPGYTRVEQRFVAHAALSSITVKMEKQPSRPRQTAAVGERGRARPKAERSGAVRPTRVRRKSGRRQARIIRVRPRAVPRARPRPRPRPRTMRRSDWAF